MNVKIFDIQRGSYVDGPGIRTVVFFKGCNLRCEWCHNPESQSFESETLHYKTGDELCGEEKSVDELMKILVRDKKYYDRSGGGVTFSGGECMLQLDALVELLERCRAEKIHTAIDTAGHVPSEAISRVISLADLFLYDVKATDSVLHRKLTGVGNESILANLSRLLDECPERVIIRVPVIPDCNDSDENFTALRELIGERKPRAIELLPYHRLGESKYPALGREGKSYEIPSDARMHEIRKILGLEVK